MDHVYTLRISSVLQSDMYQTPILYLTCMGTSNPDATLQLFCICMSSPFFLGRSVSKDKFRTNNVFIAYPSMMRMPVG